MAARDRTQWGPTVGLFLLAPVCAEYLLGYDDTTGDWLALGGGLLVLGPLYGAAALLIREATRRAGAGWPALFCLAAAWGVAEAGLVDQSMFNPAYRDIPYWDELWSPTVVPGLQVSAFAAWTFVVGHVVFSLAAPIAIVEALAGERRGRPWLSRSSLVAVAALAVAGALVVWLDHMSSETFRISGVQAITSLVAVGAFVGAAFAMPARGGRAHRAVPPPIAVGATMLLAALTFQAFIATSWRGFAVAVAITVAAFAALGSWSRATAWTSSHQLSVGAGALLGSAAAGWFVDPLGTVTTNDRLTHHIVLGGMVMAIVVLACVRGGRLTPAARRAPPASTGDPRRSAR